MPEYKNPSVSVDASLKVYAAGILELFQDRWQFIGVHHVLANQAGCERPEYRKRPFVCVYRLLNAQEQTIYAGETRDGIYERIKGHGAGSHSRKNWFSEVTKIAYCCLSEYSDSQRKMVEAALLIYYQPVYNRPEGRTT